MNLTFGVLLGSLLHLVLTPTPCNAAPGVFHSDSAEKSVPDAGQDVQSISYESSNSDHPDSDTPSAVRNTPSTAGSSQTRSALLRHEHGGSYNPSTWKNHPGGQTESAPWSYEYSGGYIPSIMRNAPDFLASGQMESAPWGYEYGGGYISNAIRNAPDFLASGQTESAPWGYDYGGGYISSAMRNAPGFLAAGHMESAPWSYEYSGSYMPYAVRNIPSVSVSGQTGRAPWSYEYSGSYHPSAVEFDPYNYGLAHSEGVPSGHGAIPSEVSYLSPTHNREGEYVYHTRCLTHGRYTYMVKPNTGSHKSTGESSFSYSNSDHMGRASRSQGVAVKPDVSSYGTGSISGAASSSRPVSSLLEPIMQTIPDSYHSSGAETVSSIEGVEAGNEPSSYQQDGYEPHVKYNSDTVKSVPRYSGYF